MLVIVWNYFGLVSYSEYLILLKNCTKNKLLSLNLAFSSKYLIMIASFFYDSMSNNSNSRLNVKSGLKRISSNLI